MYYFGSACALIPDAKHAKGGKSSLQLMILFITMAVILSVLISVATTVILLRTFDIGISTHNDNPAGKNMFQFRLPV